MFKVIFVLVINAYSGGMTTIDFTTLQQCETAKKQIAATRRGASNVGMTCIEKQVPIKKTRCKIVNDYGYKNGRNWASASNLDGYPYPVALECIEE